MARGRPATAVRSFRRIPWVVPGCARRSDRAAPRTCPRNPHRLRGKYPPEPVRMGDVTLLECRFDELTAVGSRRRDHSRRNAHRGAQHGRSPGKSVASVSPVAPGILLFQRAVDTLDSENDGGGPCHGSHNAAAVRAPLRERAILRRPSPL